MSEPLPLPAIHASHAGTWLRDSNGSTRGCSKGEAVMAAADTPLLLLNAPLVANRLGYPDLSGLDLLELFAFVRPARFCVPTPKGLAEALDLAVPDSDDEVPLLLQLAAARMMEICESTDWAERDGAWSTLQSLARLRWPWAQVLAPHVKRPERAEKWLFSRLPEWEEAPERAQPQQVALDELAVEGHLERLTGEGAEKREGQRLFARGAGSVFAPRAEDKRPHVLLAQAGTGIGKTLGYLAPASLWAERSGGTVWVSTYTKNLQRQLRRESTRAWPERRADGSRPVVVRKGRENYLCLLNLEDALQGGFSGRPAILAQLVARWAAYSQDGDMIGGDLPGWLGTLFRKRGIAALTDQRGECVYAGCPHYRKCFIERSARASAQADLVIANHALVMVNAARGRDHAQRPTRIVFDEGHHVFDAADSTFSAALTGQETIELRRWIVGPERGNRGRRRGLAARLADIASYDEAGGEAIEAAVAAAQHVGPESHERGLSIGPFERLHRAGPSRRDFDRLSPSSGQTDVVSQPNLQPFFAASVIDEANSSKSRASVFHHHRADLRRLNLVIARGFELALDARHQPFNPRAIDRAFAARDLDAAHQLFAVEGFAPAVGLEDGNFAQLNPLEGGEARAAVFALAPATDGGAVLGRAAVLHLAVFMSAIGAAHGLAFHPRIERDRRAREETDRPGHDGQHRTRDRADDAARDDRPRRGMVDPLLAHRLDLFDRQFDQRRFFGVLPRHRPYP